MMAISSTRTRACSGDSSTFSPPIMKLRIAWLLIVNILTSHAVYLPGIATVSYCRTKEIERMKENTDDTCKREIEVFVNRLNSLENLLPYGYDRFDFCEATNYGAQGPAENLGQVVFRDRIRPSPYKFMFLENETCKEVCTKTYNISKDRDEKKVDLIKKGVLFNYQHHWIIDNMPLSWCYSVQQTGFADGVDDLFCSPGFSMGCFVDQASTRYDACVIDQRYGEANSYYIFNHLNIEIEYNPVQPDPLSHEDNWEVARLVRAKVTPYRSQSGTCEATWWLPRREFTWGTQGFGTLYHARIKQEMNDRREVIGCSAGGNPAASFSGQWAATRSEEFEITYTYNVTFVESDVHWAHRWDYLLLSGAHTPIHFFSIINSLIVILFLAAGLVGHLVRSLRILRKSSTSEPEVYMIPTKKNEKNAYRWILVRHAIFQLPRMGRCLLSALLGTGVQISLTAAVTLVLACIGFLSPANRGALMSVALYSYAFLGFPAGYVASRMYRAFAGGRWTAIASLTSFLIPGIIFGVFFPLNLILWGEGSSAAIPFSTLIALLALWFCISTPLVFIGSYFGFKQRPMEFPIHPYQFPRHIPAQPFYSRPLLGIIVGGLLPFGCIFIQLFFILNSIWSHLFYYTFGFLALVTIILVVTCSLTNIVLCYMHLCTEDYRWWWRSFLTSASTAFYVLIYCIHYSWSRLELHGMASWVLYVGYTFIMVMLLFLFCGTVGFFACLLFLVKLYSHVAEDQDAPSPELPATSTVESDQPSCPDDDQTDLETRQNGQANRPLRVPGHAEWATPDGVVTEQEKRATPGELVPVEEEAPDVPLVEATSVAQADSPSVPLVDVTSVPLVVPSEGFQEPNGQVEATMG